jgi:SAM-dependent methyltransferase
MKRNCPICNSENKEFLYKQKFYKTSICLLEEYDIVLCEDCGFVFADQIPQQKEFNDYYANLSRWENNVNVHNTDKYINHFKEMSDFVSAFVINKKSLILDIGCSTGEFLNEFKKQDYTQLVGIDPSINCALSTQHNYNIPAFNKNIFDFMPIEKFNVITMSAILEHIRDLKKVVEKLNSILIDDGLLFIEVPDVSRFQEYVYTPFQQFSIEHINYFGLRSLCNLMHQNSFNLVGSKFTMHKLNSTFDPSIYVIFKKEKNKINFKKDCQSKTDIKIYIERSLHLEDKIKSSIKTILKREKKFIVWGCGTFLLRMLNNTIDINKVAYFVDSVEKYRGQKIEDKEIKMPIEIKEDFPILIASYAFQEEIESTITNKLKLKNKVLKIF